MGFFVDDTTTKKPVTVAPVVPVVGNTIELIKPVVPLVTKAPAVPVKATITPVEVPEIIVPTDVKLTNEVPETIEPFIEVSEAPEEIKDETSEKIEVPVVPLEQNEVIPVVAEAVKPVEIITVAPTVKPIKKVTTAAPGNYFNNNLKLLNI